jgi:hypothetical protein
LNSEILQSLQDDKTSARSKFRAGLLGIFNQHNAMIGDVGKVLGQLGCEQSLQEAKRDSQWESLAWWLILGIRYQRRVVQSRQFPKVGHKAVDMTQ